MRRKLCPICKQPITMNHLAVMHTSKVTCPAKYVGRWLHSACALEKGISIPKEDELALAAKNPKKVMHYHEEGCVFKVQVLKGPYPDPAEGGESFDLRVLTIIQMNPIFTTPDIGEEFTVWRVDAKTAYAGWELREIN